MILDPIDDNYHILQFEDGHKEYLIASTDRAQKQMMERNARMITTFATLDDLLLWEDNPHDATLGRN